MWHGVASVKRDIQVGFKFLSENTVTLLVITYCVMVTTDVSVMSIRCRDIINQELTNYMELSTT
jgi:hypothetical protein